MANIFISYNRKSESTVRVLADDIEALGHTVWFDQELSGGHAWWDKILETIRNCDVFVFALSPEALESVACNREYHYAAALGKAILPVQISDGMSTNLLPPLLSQIQFVDYRKQDRETAFSLGRALTNIPPPQALPDPLPDPPPVPLSYLGGITEQLESDGTLSYEAQSALLLDLKRGLRDPETQDDARTLLEKMRCRRDILSSIAEEVDELLATNRNSKVAGQRIPHAEQVGEDSAAAKRPAPQALADIGQVNRHSSRAPLMIGAVGVMVLAAVIAFMQMSPGLVTPSSNQDEAIAEAQRRAEAITRQAEQDAQQQLEAAQQKIAEMTRQAATERELQAQREKLQRLEEQLRLAQQQATSASRAATSSPAATSASSSTASHWHQVNAKPHLNVRSAASERAGVVGTVPDGGKVNVLRVVSAATVAGGHSGQWVEIDYQGRAGYAFDAFLIPLDDWRRVTAQPHLNVRSAPDVTGGVAFTVKNGEQVKVLERVSSLQSVSGERGYWVKIDSAGKTGFVFDAYLAK